MKEYRIVVINNNSKTLNRVQKEKPRIKNEDFLSFKPHTTGFAMSIPKVEVED
ncbi:MAG: hypothetical protein FWF46_06240 [Oscillospiraceae bacterium]|nr:hypothetical protein [Oscillospiraceae bacterium]